MPLSRRVFLASIPALAALPVAAHAQQTSPAFRLVIAHLRQTQVGSTWHVQVRVTIHNDSGRVSGVRTGCRSVFDGVGGWLEQGAAGPARGIDEQVQLCSPSMPSVLPLPVGGSRGLRTYLFDNPPAGAGRIWFSVRAEFEGGSYRSNRIRVRPAPSR